jgi:uncharacterized protein YkwD
MREIVITLKNTPLPAILVVGGLVFLLVAFVAQIEVGKVKVQTRRPRLAGAVGVLLLLSGVALYGVTAPALPPAATAVVASTPPAVALAEETATATSTATEAAAPTGTPTTTSTATPTALPAPDPAIIEYLLTNINAVRAANGLPPYVLNDLLTVAAQLHSQDVAEQASRLHSQGEGYYTVVSHTGSDGSSAAERVAATGYPAARVGEDIYAGRGGPQVALSWWLADLPHRSNILHPLYHEIGIGAAPGPEELVVYTLDFAYTDE